jgi:deoxycytidylate deaminase
MTTSTGGDRPEIFFALVGPAGVRLSDLSRALKEHLKLFQYESVEIKLSELLKNFTGWQAEADTTEFTRITHRQSMAYAFRSGSKDGAVLVRAGLAAIREKRAAITGSPDRPASAHAYIINQLKHPDEVKFLRQVYGPSVFVLAGHAPHANRVATLAQRMAQKDERVVDGTYNGNAERVIHIDDKEPRNDEFGQNTRDTYPLADFFANLALEQGGNSVKRFIDLTFGHPFHTPIPEELAMYHASAAALRSSDESRQVGAVIVMLTKNAAGKVTNADIVAYGVNEVPRRGGGFYWHDDSPDNRDQWLMAYGDGDRARRIKTIVLAELIEKMQSQRWLESSLDKVPMNELANKLLPQLKGTQFMDIGEFVRPVHAEMAALIDGARRGVAVHGLTMYVSTFPCHNCAKHIIAAGLRKVVYLEPYPKSRAKILHGEEINLDSIDGTETDDRVVFCAFTGIAPRHYRTLFSMGSRGRKSGLALNDWNSSRDKLTPTYIPRNAAAAYLLTECDELKKLDEAIYNWDRK